MPFKAEDFKDDADFANFIETTSVAAVEAGTAELKAKVEELIGEKRTVTDKMKEYEGVDIEAAKKALDFLDKNDVAQKIADGKFDEVLEEKTATLRSQHDDAISLLTTEIGTSKQANILLQQALDNTKIDDALRKAAVRSGLIPEAIDDVISRGRGVFSIGDDGAIEARGADGKFVKVDDKLLTPSRWIEFLPKHYWPGSESVDAQGSSTTAELDDKLAAALKKGDMSSYRKLRRPKK